MDPQDNPEDDSLRGADPPMTDTQTDLAKLESELLAEIAGASDLATLDAVRVSSLGKKGRVSELMSKLGSLPAEERKSFGQTVNAL
ncbi:phenylalanine--tRNA ligase subunit alpha, partial [Frankia sp. AgW1.1]|nr:phenylalanine--tRNA ligase subunit alpha [Frankia sp. AgW1.1]